MVNERDPCNVPSPQIQRINERGDSDEAISHPQAAADIGNGRIGIVFVAQSIELDVAAAPQTSEVRLVILDAQTGSPIALCAGTSRDETLNDAGTYAFAVSLARAPLTIAGRPAAALVSWTEGTTDRRIRMRFVDSAGCPMATTFSPFGASALSASLVWSAAKNAVLATINDSHGIQAGLIFNTGPAPFNLIADGTGNVGSYAASALVDDGTALVVWEDDSIGPRGAFLNPQGMALRPLDPRESGFDLGFPAIAYQQSGAISVSVAGGGHRFSVFLDASSNELSPPLAYGRTYDSSGQPLGPAEALDASDHLAQQTPVGLVLPEGKTFATWQARSRGGTVARLYDTSLGSALFNNVGCGEDSFTIAGNARAMLDTQSAIVVNDTLWVFFTGVLPTDSRGMGVGAWRESLDTLWPHAP